MSKKHNGVNYSMTAKSQARRRKAIERLEAQLKSNGKTVMYINGNDNNKLITVPLTEKDIARINSELATLKTRV